MQYLHRAQKEGKKFLNPVPTELSTGSNLLTLFWKYYRNKAETTPKQQLGPFSTDLSIYKKPSSTGLRITWIGHSSSLIEIDGKNILTDPVWSERASFLSWVGPKRFFPAPIQLKELPPLDAIIISHDHYNHLDKSVIKQFSNSEIPFYTSLGVGKYLEEWSIKKSLIKELD